MAPTGKSTGPESYRKMLKKFLIVQGKPGVLATHPGSALPDRWLGMKRKSEMPKPFSGKRAELFEPVVQAAWLGPTLRKHVKNGHIVVLMSVKAHSAAEALAMWNESHARKRKGNK